MRFVSTQTTERPARALVSQRFFFWQSTLWNGNCESFSDARIVHPGEATDVASGRKLTIFPDVVAIFRFFREHGVPIAIASASPAMATAKRLLRGFGLGDFQHAVVQPGKKDTHLKEIAAALHVDLRRGLFFDDLIHNIRTAEALGVGGCVQVREGGVRLDDVRRALKRLRERGKGAALMHSWMKAAAPAKDEDQGEPAPKEAVSDEVGSGEAAEEEEEHLQVGREQAAEEVEAVHASIMPMDEWGEEQEDEEEGE